MTESVHTFKYSSSIHRPRLNCTNCWIVGTIFQRTINISIINSPQGSFPLFVARSRPLLGWANPNDWPGSDQMRLQTITGLFPPANFLPLTAEQPPQATNKHPQSLVSTNLSLWCSAVSVSWPLTYAPLSIRQLRMYAQLASDLWCWQPLILGSQPMSIDPPVTGVPSPLGCGRALFWGHGATTLSTSWPSYFTGVKEILQWK